MSQAPAIERLLTEGVDHHQSGRLEAAEACYRKILEDAPGHPDALHYIGLLALQRGNFDAAIANISQAIDSCPDVPEFHVNLGNAQKRAGQLDKAEESYRKALALRPDFPAVAYNLALLLKAAGRLEEAVGQLESAICSPHAPVLAWFELGDCLRGVDEARALACYAEAQRRSAGAPDLLARLGVSLLQLGRAEQAVSLLAEARRLGGDNVALLNALGAALTGTGQLTEAERVLRRALALKPRNADVLLTLADLLKESGRNREAVESYRRAIDFAAPGQNIRSGYLLSLLYADWLTPDEVAIEHQSYCARYLPAPTIVPRRPAHRPLRIGYLSPDMHANPVAYFMLGILRAHDSARVDVHVYSAGPVQDEWTALLRAAVPHWRNVHGQSDDAVSTQIQADGIDVLIDLAGHLTSAIGVFARRAAPVQINYLGYAFSTGLPTMDYRIVDWTTDPAGSESLASETLLRLDRCYYAYTPPLDAPAIAPLPAIKRGYPTFGACCHFAKITPRTMDLWARLLVANPSARLHVRTRAFADKTIRTNFIDSLAKRNVARKRVLAEAYVPNEARWLFYQQIDIGLDTYPFNLATNTCEALWMGVPTLTFGETSHPSRMGASIMQAAGLPEFVAQNEDDWLQRAGTIAGNLERLAVVRSGLRERLRDSELCDSAGAARSLESAYERAVLDR